METQFVLINFIYYKAETILWMVNRTKLFGLVTKEREERWYRQHRFRSNFPWNEREEKNIRNVYDVSKKARVSSSLYFFVTRL